MTEPTERLERDVASWLDDGVGRAPSPLIESIVEQTRRTNQRPALLAVALGTPTLGDVRRVGGVTVPSAVVVALVVLAALAAVLFAGSQREWFDRLVVAPSASTPVKAEPSRGPTPEPTQAPAAGPQIYAGDVFSIRIAAAGDMWTGVSGQGDQHRVTFLFGSCPPSQVLCFRTTVEIGTSPIGAPIEVGSNAAGTPQSVVGSSVDDLAASWVEVVGVSNVQRSDVSGWPAVIVTDVTPRASGFEIRRSAAFIVTDGETIALVSNGIGQPRSRLLGILGGLTIRHTPKDVYLDDLGGLTIRALDRPWAEALPGMMGTGPAPDQDPSVVAFWYGPCQDNLCRGYVTVSSGTLESGAVVEVRGSVDAETELRVAGQTLDAVKTSWIAAFGPSTFETVTIDGLEGAIVRWSDRSAALFVTSRGVVAIVASPAPFGSTDTRSLLDGFLAGVEFLQPQTGQYRNGPLGFAVDSTSFLARWSGITGPEKSGPEVQRVTFKYGSSNVVTVDSAPVGSIFVVGLTKGFDPIYAGSGDGVDALAAKWAALFSSSTTETIEGFGWSGRLVTATTAGSTFAAAFIVTGKRAFIVNSTPGTSVGLRAFLDGFRILAAP